MANVTMGFGGWLVLIGLGSYFGAPFVTGDPSTSPTALIPAGAGVFMIALGGFARLEGPVRAIVSHLAVLVAVALVAMTASSVGELSALAAGTVGPPLTLAPLAKAVVCVSSVVYILASVRSFLAARAARNRPDEEVSQPRGRPLLPKRPSAK